MKYSTCLSLAWRTRRRFGITTWIFLTASMLFLCQTIQGTHSLRREKNSPWELSASADSISSDMLQAVGEISEVVAVTPYYEVTSVLSLNTNSQELTLHGMQTSYLQGTFLEGTNYPETSAVPYLVLNLAALKLFGQTGSTPEQTENLPDWSAAAVSLQIGEKKVPVRICGILAEGESPEVYLSPASACDLLREESGEAVLTTLYLRIKSAGDQAAAEQKLLRLGLAVDNTDSETLIRWEQEEYKNRFLTQMTIVCLLASICLLILHLRLERSDHKGREPYTLHGLGEESSSHKTIISLRIFIMSGSAVICAVCLFMIF